MATAVPVCRTARKRSAQARSWKPGRRRQPSGARERWKPVRGETPQAARCEARQRDRPCSWPETPIQLRRCSEDLRWWTSGLCGVRYCRAGAAGAAALQGRQAQRGGDSPQDFPLECNRQRVGPQSRRRQGSKPDSRDAARRDGQPVLSKCK